MEIDLLSLLPHGGAAVLIVLFVQSFKKVPALRLAPQWWVALPFIFGVVLGIPLSFAIGKPEWHWLIVNPLLEGFGAVAVYHLGKRLFPTLFGEV